MAKIEIFSLEDFHPELLAGEIKPFKGFKPDKAHYLIHLIQTSYSVDGKWGYQKEDGWTQLRAIYMRKRGIRDYQKYVKWLVELGYLESDGQYIMGDKSICYRIHKNIKNKAVLYEPKDGHVRRKAKEFYSSRVKGKRGKYSVLWNYLKDIDIDLERAVKEMDSQAKGGSKIRNYRSSFVALQRIEKGFWNFKVDNTAGRLHTNLTNMPKELRKFISYKGEKLVEIDFKNSQPYLASVLFQSEFWIDKEESTLCNIKQFLKGRELEKLRINILGGNFSPIMMPLFLKSLDILEAQRYNRSCSRGRFYEEFQDAHKNKNGEFIERDDVKTIVLMTMYSSNRYFHQEGALPKRIYAELYPTIYELFKAIKEEKKSRLAILLQTIEKALILDCIALRFIKENPSIPVFSIHDSLVTLVSHKNVLEKIILEESKKRIGLTAKLDIQVWE